jgi:hypothetical protein
MWRWATAACLALTATGTAIGASPRADAAARPAVFPASNRLFMISDSVGLGAIPQMKAAFGAGWQVTVAGKAGLFTEQLVNYVNTQPLSVFGDSAVVATGYNYPYWDPPRFERSIDLMVNALKAKGVKRIFWVTVREVKPPYYRYWNSLTAAYKSLYLGYPTANNQIRKALDRHKELSIVDWASIADQYGITYDAIHLNPVGATKYAALTKAMVLTATTRRPAGTVTTIQVAGTRDIPADAAAVSLNLTTVNPRRGGYLTVWPCEEARPQVAHLSHAPAQTVSTPTLVHLGSSGTLCLYQSADGHALVDLNGWFPAGSGYVPMASQQLWDTTRTGAPAPRAVTEIRVANATGAPAPPFDAVVNLRTTAVTAGEVRMYTCGTTPPLVPGRTLEAGQTMTLTQVVTTDAEGDVCVQFTGVGHEWLTVVGGFDATADLTPFTNRRIVDTRFTGGALQPGQVRTVTVAGAVGIPTAPAPTGAWLSVTMVDAADSASVKVWPCNDPTPGQVFLYTLPNHAKSNVGLIGLGLSGAVCLSTNVAGNVLVDASGWTGTSFVPRAWTRLLDTRA